MSVDKLISDIKTGGFSGLTVLGTRPDGAQAVLSNRKFSEMAADARAIEEAVRGAVTSNKVNIDGYWYPFMNDVAGRNLGYGDSMEKVLSHVKDWSVAIDGGAQVGRVANRLAEKFGKVIAIELSQRNYDCLRKNIKGNVVPILGCLTNVRGGNFTASPDKHPDSPICRAVAASPGATGTVPSITIDELGLESCGFIKLDLQGFDYFALLGAEHTLRRFKPPIFFEHDASCFERYGVTDNDPANFLKGLGYELLEADRDNQAWI